MIDDRNYNAGLACLEERRIDLIRQELAQAENRSAALEFRLALRKQKVRTGVSSEYATRRPGIQRCARPEDQTDKGGAPTGSAVWEIMKRLFAR